MHVISLFSAAVSAHTFIAGLAVHGPRHGYLQFRRPDHRPVLPAHPTSADPHEIGASVSRLSRTTFLSLLRRFVVAICKRWRKCRMGRREDSWTLVCSARSASSPIYIYLSLSRTTFLSLLRRFVVAVCKCRWKHRKGRRENSWTLVCSARSASSPTYIYLSLSRTTFLSLLRRFMVAAWKHRQKRRKGRREYSWTLVCSARSASSPTHIYLPRSHKYLPAALSSLPSPSFSLCSP